MTALLLASRGGPACPIGLARPCRLRSNFSLFGLNSILLLAVCDLEAGLDRCWRAVKPRWVLGWMNVVVSGSIEAN